MSRVQAKLPKTLLAYVTITKNSMSCHVSQSHRMVILAMSNTTTDVVEECVSVCVSTQACLCEHSSACACVNTRKAANVNTKQYIAEVHAVAPQQHVVVVEVGAGWAHRCQWGTASAEAEGVAAEG